MEAFFSTLCWQCQRLQCLHRQCLRGYASTAIHSHHALRATGSDIRYHCILPTVGSGIHPHRVLCAATHNGRPSFDYESLDINNLFISIDWRKKGAASPIRNQGKCRSCWTFSAVTAVEGIYKIRTNKLISLPVQHLVHCDKMNKRCRGGSYVNVFDFIQKNGITFEAVYSYTAKEEKCAVEI
ncbi:KDEL-tailed cysteine endopeptidase CEP2 [Platanthera zijinensis]|uniref:KDEL-tailed cysteine endopeptidase CEP2 n=1 Tax=Platanthera zijinensis TaxID=2320716 RepID=A0AAP0B8B3_9ASPA